MIALISILNHFVRLCLKNCTELLVHQKQIGVGLPHLHREEIIDQ